MSNKLQFNFKHVKSTEQQVFNITVTYKYTVNLFGFYVIKNI